MESLAESPETGRVCGRCAAPIPPEVVLLEPAERWTGFGDLCLRCRAVCLHLNDPAVSADPPYRCTRCLRHSEWVSAARHHEYGNGPVCGACFRALRVRARADGLPVDAPRAWRTALSTDAPPEAGPRTPPERKPARRGRKSRYPAHDRAAAVAEAARLKAQGRTWAQIAAKVGIAKTTLARWAEECGTPLP